MRLHDTDKSCIFFFFSLYTSTDPMVIMHMHKHGKYKNKYTFIHTKNGR